MTNSAFLGDEAGKRASLERIAGLTRRGHLVPGMKVMWNDAEQTGTFSGALAQSPDASAFADRTGLPLELSQTFELILAVSGQPAEERQVTFPQGFLELFVNWLEVVQPGADRSGVMPRFVASLLDELLAPQLGPGQNMGIVQREVVQQIAELWHRALSGQPVAANEWRAPRTQAIELADSVEDPWCAAVAEFAASVSWPPAQSVTEAPSLLQRLFSAWARFLCLPFMTAQEQDQAIEAALEPRRMRVAAQQPGFDLMNWHMRQMTTQSEVKSKERQAQEAARGREIRALAAPAVNCLVKHQLDRIVELTRATTVASFSRAAANE